MTLTEARAIVRQPERSDAEILAACKVLRCEGDWRDDWIVTQIETALGGRELEVDYV